MRNSKFKIQNAKCEMQDADFECSGSARVMMGDTQHLEPSARANQPGYLILNFEF
jgi:hypothetical protein